MNTMMLRRTFLKKCALSAAVLGAGSIMPAAASTTRPNFIFILTDDQRWDAMGFLGKYPWLKTPNIDRVRNEGIYFKNAFVTHSICSPSRASFHTGAYSHVHGVIQNESRDYDPNKTPSFSKVLGDSGYNTGFIGKWHLNYGNQPRPDFKYWLAFDAQGIYEDCVLNENGQEYTSKGYVTDVLNEKAVEFITKQDPSRPFSLFLSHKAVHQPFKPAARHAEQYAGVELSEPASFREDAQTKPQWLAQTSMKGIFRTKMRGRSIKLADQEKKWKPFFGGDQSYLDYFRSISAVDEGIGLLYSALEKKGMLQNTCIVFAGDNGYFLGEHGGRLDKRLMYEESLRIPLVMRFPSMITEGSTAEEIVLNIDLAPTLLDIAGLKLPASMQGRSWKQLFKGKNENWRKAFFYEYFMDLTAAIPDMVGVRTEDWKLIRYPDLCDIDELYDLKNDPYEMNNLALEPALAAKRQELISLLEKLERESGFDKSPWRAKPVLHQPKRPGSGLVLEYDFSSQDDIIHDISRHNNHARLSSAGSILDSPGGKMLQCRGESAASIQFGSKLKFANGPFAFEVTFKPVYDGIVASWGDRNNGFAIFVEDGMPAFAYRANGSLFIADGIKQCINSRIRLTALLSNGRAHLFVDGHKVSQIHVGPFYWPAEPKGQIQLGGISGENVLFEIRSDGFTGEIHRIRMYDSDISAEQILHG